MDLSITNKCLKMAFTLSFFSSAILIVSIPLFVNEMYNVENEMNADLQKITVIANEIWKEVQSKTRKTRSLYSRRREEDEAYANAQPPSIPYEIPKYGYGYRKIKCCCAFENYDISKLAVSYKCPVGPAGPRGCRGENGEDGIPGRPGLDGQHTFISPPAVYASSYDNTPANHCESCYPGPPGPPGPQGLTGYPGRKGIRGMCGPPGLHGKPGDYGEPGEPGKRGRVGVPGYKGSPGSDGIVGGKGAPGSPGAIGLPGVCGQRGPTGEPGEFGSMGVVGVCGPPGAQGLMGINGADGLPGKIGRPGADAEYCPCPPKEKHVYAEIKEIKHQEKSPYSMDNSAVIPPRPGFETTPLTAMSITTSSTIHPRMLMTEKMKRLREKLQNRFINWQTGSFQEKDYGLERHFPALI